MESVLIHPQTPGVSALDCHGSVSLFVLAVLILYTCLVQAERRFNFFLGASRHGDCVHHHEKRCVCVDRQFRMMREPERTKARTYGLTGELTLRTYVTRSNFTSSVPDVG